MEVNEVCQAHAFQCLVAGVWSCTRPAGFGGSYWLDGDEA